MAQKIYGIDFGTDTIKVEKRELIIPSYFSITPSNEAVSFSGNTVLIAASSNVK